MADCEDHICRGGDIEAVQVDDRVGLRFLCDPDEGRGGVVVDAFVYIHVREGGGWRAGCSVCV